MIGGGGEMITAIDLLTHLEAKLDTTIAVGGESLVPRLEELARFVREIAEAALVAGDEMTLKEARRLAARLAPFGFETSVSDVGMAPEESDIREHNCPRCGQRFLGPIGPMDRVGFLLCDACTRELLAGIRL
jgi:hypothetical protein